jgi:glycosyltransferase involved in cell wall biosynthesis
MNPFQLRVAIFTGSYNYIRDGVALTLNRLVRFLESQDVPVLVFAPVGDKPAFDHSGELVGISSIGIPGRPEYRFALGLTKEAKTRLDAFHPTLIHVATPDRLGWGAVRYASDNGIPLVGSYHTHFTSYLKYYHAQFLENAGWKYLRRFYERCRQVYVPTPSMSDVLRGHGFATDIRLWGRSVDVRAFSPEHRNPAWRRSLGLADTDCVVAFVSRLVWEKDLMTYVHAIRKVQTLCPHVRPLIVGDGPAMTDMRRLVPGAVFTGFLSGPELSRAYASSDVFLFPSDTETFGSVTLEAAASGLPVVVANATGSRSLVASGLDGYLVPPRDVDVFANCVAMLASDERLRRRMSERARLRALARPSAEAVNAQLLRYYHEVTDASPRMHVRKAG